MPFFPFVKSQKSKVKSCASGFTIIETLVAIAILLLSIIAPLTIAEKGLAGAEAARQEITAFYLAQEAIEYVRNVRDTNAIAGFGGGANWLKDLQECQNGGECGIDPTEIGQGNQIVDCSSSDSCALYQYTGSNAELKGLFGHRSNPNEWTKTNFTRKVVIVTKQNDIEAKVQATVVWKAGSLGIRTMNVSENLFNWYDSP